MKKTIIFLMMVLNLTGSSYAGLSTGLPSTVKKQVAKLDKKVQAAKTAAVCTPEASCVVNADKNQSKTICGGVVYCDNSLKMWTPTAAGKYTWGPDVHETNYSCVGKGASYPACNYCDTLNYAGYTDWVLPSCEGGATDSTCQLYRFGKDDCNWTDGGWPQSSCTPSWDTKAQADIYWSSSEFVSDYHGAYYVSFLDGLTHGVTKINGSNYYVRCVRAGP